ncbi:hypothetical protein [Collinsella ihumii]|uniref:Uncharacterized protein n=1 Tax=Collinsella ihumii TaxID=1720204 RepID=A0AAW7JQV9_9ACTN|nr:hypothetical protein [Collinsella ihumii]MDN0069724.1 hypothetical protein [Collinsella ihumii]
MGDALAPWKYNEEQDIKYNNDLNVLIASYDIKIEKAHQQFSNRKTQIQQKIDKKKGSIWPILLLFMVIGLSIGIAVCATIPSEAFDSGGNGMEIAGWALLGIPALGLVVGFLFALINSNDSDLQNELDRLQFQESEGLESLNQEKEEMIAELKDYYEDKKRDYLERYERDRREESVKYVGSSVAEEITGFILQPFKKLIEASDRRPHIHEVIVPLSFEVFCDKVVSPTGSYDFTIKRVKHLSGMDEVSALTNAIATAIHSDVISSYPVDLSGGEVFPMDIEYSYGQNYVKASMTYHAVNSGYVEERSF